VDTFKPVNKCPFRSPVAVSDAIKNIIEDKVVCELGCAEGDNMVFMARYAKKVFGMENMMRRYKVAQQRGLEVIVGDYWEDDIPDADVYYFWPNDGEKDNEFLVDKLCAKKCTIIVAGDTGKPSEIPSVKRCAEKGELMEVPFHEGNGHREHGIFLLAIIKG